MLHKRWKKGGNKWQSKSITWKRIMSPVKYTLCSVSLCFFFFFLPTAHIFEIEFWKPYTLLTPFMLHQFTEVDSFLSFFFFTPALFLFCFHDIKSNKQAVCSWHLCSFLIQHIKSHNATYGIQQGASSHSGEGGSQNDRKNREGEDNQASTI